MPPILGLSLQSLIEKAGAYAGLASLLALAVLSLLYFAQARELRRLRDWAGRSPERAQELEERVAAQADAARQAPAVTPGATAAKPAAAAPAEMLVRKLVLHVAPGVPDSFLEELKEIVGHHPGKQQLLLAVGQRRLALGPDFTVSGDCACQAELGGLHGAARVVA